MTTKLTKQMRDELRRDAGNDAACPSSDEILIPLDAIDRLEGALKFYGYEAIHNPECGDKSQQYWNDAGIWDHGERARSALKATGAT